MTVRSEVAQWADAIVRVKGNAFETLRCKAAAHWKNGKRIHKLRTQSRRLRAALEDLRDCVPNAGSLLSRCKKLGADTADARDSIVMIERLERYRRTALPAERKEIKTICDDLWKINARGLKKAKRAAKACAAEPRA